MTAAAAPAHHLNPPVPILRIHGGEHIRLRCNRVIGTGQPSTLCPTRDSRGSLCDCTTVRNHQRQICPAYAHQSWRSSSPGHPPCDDRSILATNGQSRSANPFPQFGREAGCGEREPLMSACVTDKQNYDTGTSPGATAVNIGAGQRDLARPG